MTRKKLYTLGSVGMILLIMLACEFSASTANIKDAIMARDPDGNDPTTVFAPGDTFYCVVDLANAPDDTTVRAVWFAANVEGVEPDYLIDEAELTTGGGELNFELSNTDPWPSGTYKVELYLNDELDRTLEFNVQ
jgi:hypothetical protein